MPILTCHTLNSAQKARIHSLEEECRKRTFLTLSFPMDGFDFCLLYFDEQDTLLSAAAFTQAEENAFECSAFTVPEFRNLGLFSLLLEEGLRLLPEETDLLFYSDGRCPDTEKAREALGAEYLSCDYMMELSPEMLLKSGASTCRAIPGSPPPAVSVDESPDEEGVPLLYFRSKYGEALVSCQKACYYFYSFEIREEVRGLGHGKKLLFHILKTLHDRHPMPVRLQVSGDNLTALSLYKKTGFRVTDTLSTYLY